MTLQRFCSVVALVALGLAWAHGAGTENPPYDSYQANDLSYAALKLNLSDRTNDIRVDGVNRVWFATNRGVAAVQGTSQANFFPLTTVDGLAGNSVAAVAFGPLEKQENFFLGFNETALASGIQYGRVLADTGLSPKPPTTLRSSVDSENIVFGLASDGADNLWAATLGGLVWWTLGGKVPERNTADPTLKSGDRIGRVAADPWVPDPHVVFVDESEGKLYVLPNGNAPEQPFANLSGVVGLAFDASRNLWVVALDGLTYRIFKFAEGNPTTPYQSGAQDFLFEALRTPVSIAVDPLNPSGTVVWVGTDTGAYFQRYSEVTGELEGGWTLASTGSTDSNVRVYVDTSGNVWFGSSFGVRSLLSRLVTMNSSRYVGYGAEATVNLLDVSFAGNGGDPDQASVAITKAGSTAPELTLTATETQDDGQFTFTFTFAEATDATKNQLGVTEQSASFNTVYTYTLGGEQKILPPPLFSWANIIDFDDDAWVGNPCFVDSLRR